MHIRNLNKNIINKFGKEYLTFTQLGKPVPQKITRKQVAFVINSLRLQKGKSILDIGCGTGRHTVEFAKRGYRVTCVEPSQALLTAAKENMRKQNVQAQCIQKDLLDISIDERFDAAVSIASFGFLKTKNDHLKMLQKINTLLKPGGRFFLSTGNITHIIADNPWRKEKQESETILVGERIEKKSRDGTIAYMQEFFDRRSNRYITIGEWEGAQKKGSVATAVYLFTLPEIKKMLESAGFSVEKTYGDFDGSPLSKHSPRMIITAMKKDTRR